MSDLFEEDLDLRLPEISVREVQSWLSKRISVGIEEIEKGRRVYEAISQGEMPREAFSLEKFNRVKRSVALYKQTFDLLQGVYGLAPSTPADDMDEQFFDIVKSFRRDYQLTKESA